jgi:hypothetical protein
MARVIITSHESQENTLRQEAHPTSVKYPVRKSFCVKTLKEKVAETLESNGHKRKEIENMEKVVEETRKTNGTAMAKAAVISTEIKSRTIT